MKHLLLVCLMHSLCGKCHMRLEVKDFWIMYLQKEMKLIFSIDENDYNWIMDDNS